MSSNWTHECEKLVLRLKSELEEARGLLAECVIDLGAYGPRWRSYTKARDFLSRTAPKEGT